jgi:hypothetical protein
MHGSIGVHIVKAMLTHWTISGRDIAVVQR